MVRLVHPAPAGKVSARPNGHKSQSLYPTLEERRRIRVAANNIARAYGGRDVLAAVMGVSAKTIANISRGTSYALAVLLARAAGISVEQLLSGKPHEAGTCALCGRKGAR